jgi:Dockerin type I domain
MQLRSAALCAGILLGVFAPAAASGQVFLRGDVSDDGFVNIADVFDALVYIADAGPTPSVLAAADVNDNGVVEIADVCYLLNFIFPGGPAPPLPFPAPGIDPTPPSFPTGPSGGLEFRLGDTTGVCGGGTVVPLFVTSTATLEALNFRVAFDPLSLTVVGVSVAPIAAILGVNPEFSGTTMEIGGFSLAVVFSFANPTAGGLPPVVDEPVADIVFLVGTVPSGQPIDIAFQNDATADPPQYNMGSIAGQVVLATGIDGSITPTCLPPEFRRGDANEDGAVSISDGVFLIQYLFQSGPTSDCEQAMDANADGARNVADPIFLLTALFAGGATIPAPYPGCGPSLVSSPYGCASYPPICP